MSPEDRPELEARAERSVRRGELSEALALYRSLVETWPHDAPLAHRLRNLEESLQPAELLHPKARLPAEPAHAGGGGPEQEGERLFALGDCAGAMAAYRRALAERPDSMLVRERLEELYALARSAPQRPPTAPGLPTDAVALLGALLDRIASRRRV